MTRLIGVSRIFVWPFEFLALALAVLLSCAAWSGSAGAEEEEAEARSPALPLPAAGSHPTSRGIGARALGVVDLRALAREQAKHPAAPGPLVGQAMPEPMEMEEPDAPATNTFHATLVQSPAAVSSPGAIKSFAGLDDIAKLGTSSIVIPPDVDGAVGLTKLMECLNNNYRVFDKSNGNVLSTVSISVFWSATGFSNTVFDPRVLYDPYNDRFLLAAVANAGQPGASILLGISQTGDPEGAYNLFAIDADPTDANWADFPTIGFNKNWVAINVNLVSISGGTITGSKCAVIDYPTLRTGSATGTIFSGTGFVSSPAATYSTTENTLYVPTHLSSGGGTYRIDTITGTASAPVYTVGGTLNRGLVWTQPSSNILPQAAPLAGASVCGVVPCKIETQDAQIRSTPVFRNGSIYYTQTVVPSGTSHTAVQWTKVNPVTGTVQDGGRIEDASATSGNGGKWYAYPHIAVNSCGDVIIGYTQFSSAQYPSAGYSFRFGTDAAGTFRDPVIAKPGEDYYHKDFGSTPSRNRWGDYSKAQVDPSDDQSMWVLDEYAKLRQGTDDGTTGSNASRWGTWWAKVGPGVSMGGGPVATEGNTGTKDFNFTVIQTMPVCAAVAVGYTVNPGTATLADGDYQAPGSSIVIPANNTTGTITVKVVGDTKRESDEGFSVSITSVSVGEVGLGNTATATITNDDPIPTITLVDGSLPEGDAGTTAFALPITLSNPSDQTITVDFATQDNSATLADNDYLAATGTATFPPGSVAQDASFNVNGDTKTEADEIVVVNLSNPANASMADGSGNATLLNDDGPPSISIDDVSLVEGNAGTSSANFTITLSHISDQAVSVSYQTSDRTATLSDGDYATATGTANIPSGSLTAPVSVLVNGDAVCEPDETFRVTLSSPSGGTIGDGSGQGTITNDDECDSPVVTVLAPNGDEWHYLGEAVDFTWNATDNLGVTSVDLRLSRDGGGSYEDVALGEANDGLYTWTASGPPTDQALLQVTAHDASDNTGSDVSEAMWHVADVVDVPPGVAVTEFALGPIRPNPSRGEVTISYALPRAAPVRIEILDVQGRVLATLVTGEASPGRHAVRWQPAHSVPSGLFFARARLGGKVVRQRFVVTR